MPTPVFEEHIDACEVCGDVCCEKDAVWIESEAEKVALGLDPGPEAAWVCTDCASLLTTPNPS